MLPSDWDNTPNFRGQMLHYYKAVTVSTRARSRYYTGIEPIGMGIAHGKCKVNRERGKESDM